MKGGNYQLSDFQTLGPLGEGSFSKVKLVRRNVDAQLLALKQIQMDKLSMSQKNSALNQIRLLASITSPYVISYEGSFYSPAGNCLCLLMEYADNGDLEGVINSQARKAKMEKGLPEEFIWRTILHLLQGLKTLHENKIVHRDLKAANIFYSKGIAKIGDLNVSAVSDNAFYSTKTGTPYYTAPEIWKGQKYTTNCDIWSLGCIAYEMCSLLPPFRAETFPELFVAISRGQYQPLSTEYSDDIRTFIRMCLNVNPLERPTGSELLDSSILIKKMIELQDEVDASGKVQLLKPIKCPKVLRFINTLLPQTNTEDQKTSFQQSQKTLTKSRTLTRKKTVRIDENSEGGSMRRPSISRSKGLITVANKTKSSVRIKSSTKINTSCHQSKSSKIIQDILYDDEVNRRESLAIEGLKEGGKGDQKSGQKSSKSQKFRLRSCKKIGEKENIN